MVRGLPGGDRPQVEPGDGDVGRCGGLDHERRRHEAPRRRRRLAQGREAQALDTIKNNPDQGDAAIAAELGITPAEAAAQVRQGVYLSPAEVASKSWLGTDGKPDNVATNLHDAAVFLNNQKQIPAVPDQAVFDSAIYTKGLPDVLSQS